MSEANRRRHKREREFPRTGAGFGLEMLDAVTRRLSSPPAVQSAV